MPIGVVAAWLLSASVLLVIGSHGDRFHGDVSAVRGTVANWSNVSIVSNTVEDVV
ncbi:transporter [Cutibacterium namnetense]|uniref:Transporter n=1 Tax=Cutibacterium namnetense TaxID=1574624 RepID=A0ABX9ICY6_9ACTN|nr:transporter [Cutibacterium namnetense]TKW71686.1 MAG: transporter [Cutibacterium acnes]